MGSYTSEDPNLALLTYRSTPLQNGLSLSELPMGPRLKTQLPVLPNTLKPKAQDLHTVKQKEDDCRSKQQKNFNLRYRARDLPNLHKGDKVWVRDQSREAEVVSKTPHPRSYLVKTEKGVLRRNRSALVSHTPTEQKSPEPQQTDPPLSESATDQATTEVSQTKERGEKNTLQKLPTTRSGRIVKPPEPLDL